MSEITKIVVHLRFFGADSFSFRPLSIDDILFTYPALLKLFQTENPATMPFSLVKISVFVRDEQARSTEMAQARIGSPLFCSAPLQAN